MSSSTRRPRAPQGEGERLRGELVEAARRVLVREVSHEAVTLRAVARELGVSAPSIYLHFADRDELVRAALGAQFDRLTAAVAAAVGGAPTARAAMRAGLLAYCRFAAEEPGGYAVMFARPLPPLGGGPVGTASFDALVAGAAACIADGTFAAGDPRALARRLWAALHGTVSLRAVMPQFGWDPIEDAVDDLLTDFGAGPRTTRAGRFDRGDHRVDPGD